MRAILKYKKDLLNLKVNSIFIGIYGIQEVLSLSLLIMMCIAVTHSL